MALNIIFPAKSRAKFEGVANLELDASISESHSYTAEVTTNPVESGGEITDHVTIKPDQLTIEGFVTDTPVKIFEGIQDLLQQKSGSGEVSKSAYETLKLLFESKQPFTVVTGLTTYSDMVLKRLSIPRDRSTGQTLRFTAELQQVEFAQFQETELEESTLSETLDTKDQAQAKKDVGKQALQPPTDGEVVQSSLLFDAGQSLGWIG
jgi:hypothetical protein